MITVIVPVYNAKNTVARCVETILAQRYSDFELILVDDGSTDGTYDLLDSLAASDDRVKVFHKANGGVSSARNVGLDHAKGDYITFADADDWVEDTWLQDFAAVAGTADIIFQNAVWHYPDGRLFLRSVDVDKTLPFKEQFASLYPRNFVGYVWATLFKASIIDEFNVRFDTRFSAYEDLDFSLKYILHAQSLIVLPCRNYHYDFPESNARDYSKPTLSRLVLKMTEKDHIFAILGEDLARGVSNDTAIKYEFMRIYSSDGDRETKRKALQLIYGRKPLDYSGGGRNVLLSCIVNFFPQRIANKLLLLLSKT